MQSVSDSNTREKSGMSSLHPQDDCRHSHAHRPHWLGIRTNRNASGANNAHYWSSNRAHNVLLHSRRLLSHEKREKYALRLFVFALISHVPFCYYRTGQLPFPFSKT